MKKSTNKQEYRLLQKLLRDTRKQAELNQSEVAELLGQPQSYVSKYESGERRLDLIELRQICKILNIPLTELVQRFDDLLAKG